ncbi:winged helix-turn-helix domain-containing protein [Flavobacterium sp.]|uniref:winged helix-turn-helix domain-containing protein n=1 Tax=Flavobacterium sp. TaxID=239 RepID=UPI002FDA16C0
MNTRKLFFYGSLLIALLSALLLLTYQNNREVETALTKIALRDVGNKLLLANGDSTSLILPVKKSNDSKYQLTFEKELTIHPDSLVSIVENSFKKANLHPLYQIEVKQCRDFEVAYSYQKSNAISKDIIPCSGRILPQNCYSIEVQFVNLKPNTTPYHWILLLIISLFAAIYFFFKKDIVKQQTKENLSENGIAIGKLQFYPEENKLMTEGTEISLSKKEVELLTLFVANPNKIIKREELSKKVWEDHGVFVGRSLDTYISKLRKKLSEDESIKLTNVHGIGYVLEVKETNS